MLTLKPAQILSENLLKRATIHFYCLKKNYYQDLFEKNKTDLSKTWEAIRFIVNVRRKSKRTPGSLKYNGALLFNPVKIAETFNFFFTNIGTNIGKRIPKGKNHVCNT